jgi:hypothetical protein
MKNLPGTRFVPAARLQAGAANLRIMGLVAGVFLMGLGLGAYWFSNARQPQPVEVATEATPQRNDAALSQATLSVLSRLNAPVEIRFHSVLSETRAADSWREFAGRVEGLLGKLERAGAGRIKVKRFDSGSKAEAKAAAQADGLETFSVDAREASFLGLAVVSRNQKVSLPRLSPEWEAALEFDLARAISRVMGATVPEALVVNPAPVDSAATEELMQALPNLAALSLPEATQQLRDAALEEFKTAVSRMQEEMSEARQRLIASGADPRASVKALQQLQAEQTVKLDQIPRRLQARITALEQLKGLTSTNPPR